VHEPKDGDSAAEHYDNDKLDEEFAEDGIDHGRAHLRVGLLVLPAKTYERRNVALWVTLHKTPDRRAGVDTPMDT
jgi:hypothetical protein